MQYATNTLEHHWMPFTANRSFKDKPKLIVRAQGMYCWDQTGHKIMDGCSGLFCVSAGHGRAEIREAVANILDEIDYVPHFSFGHPSSYELARRIAGITPDGINHIFFCNSGSESVDTALKIALAYHHARGEAQRVRFVGRERAYHGVNFGGLSVSGMVKNREVFGVCLPGVVHMRHTWTPEQRFSVGQPESGAELAEDLQRIVDTFGAHSIAAVIVEPIAGSTGVLVAPKGYLERLREICDDTGILLIFDEVKTGYGRTGKAFASQSFEVTPDIMTMAKAIANGVIPIGAVAVRDEIYETITDAAPEGVTEFFHGYTHSANPVACAAGIAAMNIYENEELFERAGTLSPYFLEQMFALQELPAVYDIRGYGLLAGVELTPGDKIGARGHDALQKLFAVGLLVRAPGDTLVLAPPLIAEESHIDEMCALLRQVLTTL